MSKVVATKMAPAAIGPYSQAVITGNIVFTSGQIPLDPETGLVVGDSIKEQAVQSLKNVLAILDEAGTDAEHAIKTTCFLADMSDFPDFNEVYATFFPNCPARSCVAVKTLPKGVLVEVEVIAELK